MMKLFALTVLLAVGSSAALAQPAKKAALKSQPQRGVRGTTPLEGDVGRLGVTYTLPDSPWNFTLKSAEFTVGRVIVGNTVYAPQADQKLLLLRYAFDTLGAARVVWHTDINNVRSQDAIARLGATREGELRKHRLRRDGSWRTTVQYSMTDDDWPAARSFLEGRLARG